jgi:alpha-galactosidase
MPIHRNQPSPPTRLQILAALCLTLALAGCGRLGQGGAAHSWTLANDAMQLTISQDARGRLGTTRLRDVRTGYEWCSERTPSPAFQVDFLQGGEHIALSGRSPLELLKQRQETAADGTQTLWLRVRPPHQEIEIDLSWRLRPGVSPLESEYTIANRGETPTTVTRLATFSQLVEAEEIQTLHYVQKGTALPGTLRVHERTLNEGESETLYCSPGETRDQLDAVPWFLLDRGQSRGGLLFAWAFSAMGRFVITRAADTTIVSGGLQPDRFRHDLLAGRTLQSPPGLLMPYAGDPDDAARDWQRFFRRYWSPPPPDPLFPRLHYNTWYSLGLDVDEASCLREMRAAAALGLETFHLDAGWYREIGDWHPAPARFPHGLRWLAREAKRRGMRFGLWVAFTQISEEMLRKHPDWITTPGQSIEPNRPFPFRTLTICLGNPVARDWVRQELERVIQEYEVDLLEYDQPIIEECTVPDHGHQAGDGGYAATMGFYEICEDLRRKFPHLLIENCMDGGHIMDFGVARLTQFTSVTDYCDALRSRITLHGATFPFPAYACEGYMQGDASVPAEFLFRSFMPGLWSNSADIATWDARTRALARRHIALYKQLRPLIRDGDVYHILPQATGRDWDGIEYYDPKSGEGVVFVFRPRAPDTRRRIRLAGLEEGPYEVRVEGASAVATVRGATLKQEGVEVTLPTPFSTAILRLRRAATSARRP